MKSRSMKECKVRFHICEKSWRRYVANGTDMRSIFFSLSDRYSIYIVFRFQKLSSGQLFAAVCVPFWFFHILGVTSKHLCSLKKRKCVFKMANSDKHFMFRASKTTQISNQIHDNQKLANTGTITLRQQSHISRGRCCSTNRNLFSNCRTTNSSYLSSISGRIWRHCNWWSCCCYWWRRKPVVTLEHPFSDNQFRSYLIEEVPCPSSFVTNICLYSVFELWRQTNGNG